MKKTNIELYIKNIDLKDKVDTARVVNKISEDLDIIEDEITVLESKEAQDNIIEALDNIKTKFKKLKETHSKS